MSKRGKKKPLPSPPRRGARPSLQPHAERQQALQRAEKLISEGQAREAIDLLEPLLARYPRVADVHHLFGYACVVYGDVWTGLAAYEQAAQLSRHPIHWLPLAWLYLDLELNVHALQAFRQALRRGVDAPELDDVQKVMAHLEDRIRETAEDLDLSVPQVERGLRSLELGGRALQAGDYAASVAANRLAIKLLPGWPPPHNNLALGLFFEGKPQEAMAITRQVLSQHPTNLQALANSIRFLTWSGQEEEARALWPRLQAIEPEVASDRLKLAEAAAILNQDEFVWQVLRPLDRADAAELVTPDLRQ